MQQSQSQSIEVNGAFINYRMAGNGQALIFIHGFPFNQHMWDNQFEQLQKDFKVITFDLRGFALSSQGNEKSSIDLFASDLLALIEHLNIKDVVACGLSMGGYILMNALSRSPERFKAAILSDTQCIADSEEGKQKRSDTIKKIEAEGLTKFSEDYMKLMFTEKAGEKIPVVVEEARKLILSNKQTTVTEGLKALAERKETCNALKDLKIPVLVICGKEDKVTPLTQSELMHNSLENGQIKIIDNAAHLSNLEQPEEFNRAIKDFVVQLKVKN